MKYQDIFNTGLDYDSYRKLVDELVDQNKTTGNDQSELKIEYTKLNIQRMNRIDKTVHLSQNQIENIPNIEIDILFIGDAWCGDTAQILPIISKIEKASSGNIRMKIVSRDTSNELSEKHDNQGIISIPKLLFINRSSNDVMAEWGSRPQPAIEILKKWKANLDTMSKEDFEKELHLWYARDKGQHIIEEVLDVIKKGRF